MDGWFWLVNSMHGLIHASYEGDFSMHRFNQGHLLEEENLIKLWTRQVVGVRMRRDTRKTFCTINTKISLLDWAPPETGQRRKLCTLTQRKFWQLLGEGRQLLFSQILGGFL